MTSHWTRAAVFLLSSGLFIPMLPISAHAEALTGFDPENIISDANMYGDVAYSMDAEDIQDFLDDKGARCVRGADGSPCLKNATFQTESYAPSRWCSSAFEGNGNDTAAQVIAKAARACEISPKVLLVLLQKEQGLITSQNPTKRAYSKATGFACPDTAPCDPSKAGFPTQVYAAASRLQQYRLQPERFNHAVGRTSSVAYHPNKSCGSRQLTMATAATAALYNYTPYLPNAAALANPYGTGDSCSAYGNRNFYRLHRDWFGVPNDASDSSSRTEEVPAPVPTPEGPKDQAPAPGSEAPQNPQHNEDEQTSPPALATPQAVAENLRIQADALVSTSSSLTEAFPLGNWDSEHLHDVAKVAVNGDLLLTPHTGPSRYAREQKIGRGWDVMRSIMGGADFDGDQKEDIIAVNKAHDMYLYRGIGRNGFGRVSKIGMGWQIFNELLFLPQGPGRQPAIAGRGTGGQYVYSTNGRGQWAGRQVASLPSLQGAVAGPDFTGTGYSTIIAPDSSKSIGVYTTNNGVTFARHGSLTISHEYTKLLAVSPLPGTSYYVLDIVMSDGRVYAVTLDASAAQPQVKPPLPPAKPSQPHIDPHQPPTEKAAPASLWKHAAFTRSKQVGREWPHRGVYSMGDFNGDGSADAAIMWNNGDLVLYPASQRGSVFHAVKKIGTGWNVMTDIHTGVDFDGDAQTDVVARSANGDLWLYPGNGHSGFKARRKIGVGWNVFDTVHLLRQGANGSPIIYGVAGEKMRPYPTNGKGDFLAIGKWIQGQQWVKGAIASDDWDNDGTSDFLYKAPDGALYVALQRGHEFDNPLERRIGTGWNGYSALVPAHIDARSKVLWVVAPDGKLHTYQWNVQSAGSFVSPAGVR